MTWAHHPRPQHSNALSEFMTMIDFLSSTFCVIGNFFVFVTTYEYCWRGIFIWKWFRPRSSCANPIAQLRDILIFFPIPYPIGSFKSEHTWDSFQWYRVLLTYLAFCVIPFFSLSFLFYADILFLFFCALIFMVTHCLRLFFSIYCFKFAFYFL